MLYHLLTEKKRKECYTIKGYNNKTFSLQYNMVFGVRQTGNGRRPGTTHLMFHIRNRRVDVTWRRQEVSCKIVRHLLLLAWHLFLLGRLFGDHETS